jgi:hypothetical protein
MPRSPTTTSCWWISGRPGAGRVARSRRPTPRRRTNTEAEQGLAAAAEIQAIPTLMAFKKGHMVFRHSGMLPADQLENIIDKIKEFDVEAAIAEQATASQH